MNALHMPKGPGLFLTGVSLIGWCAVGLLSVLISWAVGGTEFKDSIFGNAAMLVFVVGIVLGAILSLRGRTSDSERRTGRAH